MEASSVFEGSGLAVQQLPPDMAIMKMENEQIMTLAAVRPRDHSKILAELKAQLECYPSFAAGAIYAKPVGKDPETGRQKVARGLSVRAAESIREAYGFNRVSTFVEPIDSDTVRLGATFVDYQKGSVWQSTGILSKFYKNRKGDRVRYDDDRFYNVVVMAALSKHVREVILRSVPAGLKSELFELADRMAMHRLDPKVVEKTIAAFAAKNVTLEMLEGLVGRTKANWTAEDRKTLLEVWQAVEDGETTVAEAFGLDGAERQAQSGRDAEIGRQARADADARRASAESAVAPEGEATPESVTPIPQAQAMSENQRKLLMSLVNKLGIKGSGPRPGSSAPHTVIMLDDDLRKAMSVAAGENVFLADVTSGMAIILIEELKKREAQLSRDQATQDAGDIFDGKAK